MSKFISVKERVPGVRRVKKDGFESKLVLCLEDLEDLEDNKFPRLARFKISTESKEYWSCPVLEDEIEGVTHWCNCIPEIPAKEDIKMENKYMPAMPQVMVEREYSTDFMGGITGGASRGLTKREYFAGLAMQGLLSDSELEWISHFDTANFSVEMADVLLKALEREDNG